MFTNEEVAASLLRKLARAVGHVPTLQDVQIVTCEDDAHVMIYCDIEGDQCIPLVIPTPPFFEADEVACLMMRGLLHVTVH